MLDLDAVVEHQQQHAQRHAHRHVQVGGRQNAVVIEGIAVFRTQAGQAPDGGQQVNRQQVQRVHQDDPEEHGERQRGDEKTALGVVDDALGLVVDHVDDHFHESLEAGRHATGGAASSAPQEENHDQTHQAGPEQRVVIDDVELSNCALFLTGIVQMHQVMLNIRGLRRHVAGSSHLNPTLFAVCPNPCEPDDSTITFAATDYSALRQLAEHQKQEVTLQCEYQTEQCSGPHQGVLRHTRKPPQQQCRCEQLDQLTREKGAMRTTHWV
ncbi:hypothetical protein G6F31_016458 [Rhizopus arrhizus]|nr:hypothetical protein G6F31_016458 [Rhizopus arrhizus]